MSMNTCCIGAGQQIDPPAQRDQVLAQHRLQLAGVTEGELPQQRSHRRGCVHPVEQRLHPAAAHHVDVIDAVRARTHPRDQGGQFRRRVRRPGLDPRCRDPNLLREQTRAARSAAANVITGTSPAHDTRLSSSNTAESAANLCDTCTGSAFLNWTDCCVRNTNHPSSEGTFLIPTPGQTPSQSVDRGLTGLISRSYGRGPVYRSRRRRDSLWLLVGVELLQCRRQKVVGPSAL